MKKWNQKVLLKSAATGEVINSHEFECIEDDPTNTDGIFDAFNKFNDDNIDQDEAFDTLVIDQEAYEFESNDNELEIMLEPADRI